MSTDHVATSLKGRVVSLVGLCAVVVGKELGVGQEGDRDGGEASTDDEERGKEGEETARWIDEIYEGIPFHIRR